MRLAALLVAATLVAACGADRSGGPTGDPTAIVRAAPDRTVAAGSARVAVATPNGNGSGTIDLGSGKAVVSVKPANQIDSAPEFIDPAVAVDVIRAVASVRVFGGAEVRGASTIKYELDVAPPPDLLARLKRSLRGDTFYADVFIDSQRRIRRVAYPLDLNEKRPSDTHKILAKLVTIDFYDFGVKAG